MLAAADHEESLQNILILIIKIDVIVIYAVVVLAVVVRVTIKL